MLKYILAHWRGQQGVLLTCLLNGMVIPFLAPVTVLLLASIACASVLPPEIYHDYDAKPVVMFIVYAFIVMLLVCEIWATVGVLRCGARYIRDGKKGIIRKAGTVAAAVAALFLSVSTIRGVTFFSLAFPPDRVSRLIDSVEAHGKQKSQANQDAQIIFDEMQKQKRLRHDE